MSRVVVDGEDGPEVVRAGMTREQAHRLRRQILRNAMGLRPRHYINSLEGRATVRIEREFGFPVE